MTGHAGEFGEQPEEVRPTDARPPVVLEGLDQAIARVINSADHSKLFQSSQWASTFPSIFAASSLTADATKFIAQLAIPSEVWLKSSASYLPANMPNLATAAEQISSTWIDAERMRSIFEEHTAWTKSIGVTEPLSLAISRLTEVPGLLALSNFNAEGQLADLLRTSKALSDSLISQRDYFSKLARHISEVGASELPPNWVEMEMPENLEVLLLDEGLPLAWIPPKDVLRKLFAAESAGARRRIISANRKTIVEACFDELSDIKLNDAALSPWVDDFALEAAHALREGRWRASQALSANLIDSILRNAIEATVVKEVKSNPDKRIDWERFPMKSALVLGGLYGIHVPFHIQRGDVVPTSFSRHASVHGVSIRQYKQVNAVIALMHLVGLLRLVETEAHAAPKIKKRGRAKRTV